MLFPGRTTTLVDADLTKGTQRVSGPDRDRASAPGSTLKPVVLLTAMRLGVITPHTRVACTGVLRVAGRNLACAHPASLGVLDAEEALAYSCNTYLARVAQQLQPLALRDGMQRFGIHTQGIASSPEERILLALGLEGVSLTPIQVARVYADLARALQQASPQADTVLAGLLGSVAYGMAHASQTSGFTLGGKTGTAHDPAPMLQHGWFAGIAFTSATMLQPTHVVVVYAPGGSGNDAAIAAHGYLQSKPWH